MSDRALTPWPVSQLFAWQARQTGRYERVGGSRPDAGVDLPATAQLEK